jgi:hypothetical protein
MYAKIAEAVSKYQAERSERYVDVHPVRLSHAGYRLATEVMMMIAEERQKRRATEQVCDILNKQGSTVERWIASISKDVSSSMRFAEERAASTKRAMKDIRNGTSEMLEHVECIKNVMETVVKLTRSIATMRTKLGEAIDRVSDAADDLGRTTEQVADVCVGDIKRLDVVGVVNGLAHGGEMLTSIGKGLQEVVEDFVQKTCAGIKISELREMCIAMASKAPM